MSEEQLKPKNKLKNGDPSLPLIHTESLMEILDFNRGDLEMNRNGGVTAKQKDKIKEVLKGEADSMWLLTTIFLGVAVLLALIFTMQGYPPVPLAIGAGVVILPMVAIAYFRQGNLRDDVDRLRTYQIEGVPYISPSFKSVREATLNIGEEKFPISIEQAEALNEFSLPPMRVNYAANSKQILSAEVLSDREIDKLKNEDLLSDEDADFMLESERQLDDVPAAQQQSNRQ
ncbi:MAG: hypothetical protein AAF126_16105 [Chloroflexota bacterium]